MKNQKKESKNGLVEKNDIFAGILTAITPFLFVLLIANQISKERFVLLLPPLAWRCGSWESVSGKKLEEKCLIHSGTLKDEQRKGQVFHLPEKGVYL